MSEHAHDVLPMRRLHRRDGQPVAFFENEEIGEGRISPKLRQREVARLVDYLYIDQEPAGRFGLARRIEIGRRGVKLGGVYLDAGRDPRNAHHTGLRTTGVVEQHPIAHLHAVAHEIAGLVVAHAGPAHGGVGHGQHVVNRGLGGLGFHEPVVGHGGSDFVFDRPKE